MKLGLLFLRYNDAESAKVIRQQG